MFWHKMTSFVGFNHLTELLIHSAGMGNNLVLASDETLEVSADGATWVNATGINKAWATADDAVTLIAGTGKTLTARVIDTAGNVTALPLSDNSYTLAIVIMVYSNTKEVEPEPDL
jgi:hypothetical protein